MKLCNITDTHNLQHHIIDKMEEADLLLDAGDFTMHGTRSEVESFFKFLLHIEHRYDKIVFCAGNHDFYATDDPQGFREMVASLGSKFVYLEDEEYIYNGIKIYGTPWTTTFSNWTFMLDAGSIEMAEKRLAIPLDTQILISHSPPYGICDIGTSYALNLGCELLRQRVDTIKPKFTLCGHLHAGYGMMYKMHDDALYVNASICPIDNTVEAYDPITVDVEFQ